MCSTHRSKDDKANKKYLILCLVFIIGVIGFVLIVLHSTGTLKHDTLYPLKPCSFTGPLTEARNAIKNLTKCNNNFPTYKIRNENGYIILYNYVISSKRFDCEESVTYATHSDYSFLDNLQPLVERWNGPISLAIHAPGEDFVNTVLSIVHLRNCVELVGKFVTFHLYYLEEHSPIQIPQPEDILSMAYNCSSDPPYKNVSRLDMYVKQNNLTYPINIGRNVARTTSQTHFVIVSDIELYPSPNIVPNFLKLIAGCEYKILPYKPTVFVLHIFEIEKDAQMPTNKTGLVQLLNNGTVIPFHKNICAVCHTIPKFEEWKNSDESEELQIFNIGKRTGAYYHWEPIYIGTNAEPKYDERLNWEGMKDKVVQGYELCLMNYTFMVLDNAFLIHKPGIKVSDSKNNKWRKSYVDFNDKLIVNIIVPELKEKYKNKSECHL